MNAPGAVVGAILGGLVGVALFMLIEVGLEHQAQWFAVANGLLVGLGVRKMDPSVKFQASYLRGAMAALVALAAILGGSFGASSLALRQAAQNSKPVERLAGADQGGDAADAGDDEEGDSAGAAEEAAPEESPTIVSPGDRVNARRPNADDFSPFQFAMIAVGVFLAYEMARGAGTGAPAEGEQADGAPPADGPNSGGSAPPRPAPAVFDPTN